MRSQPSVPTNTGYFIDTLPGKVYHFTSQSPPNNNNGLNGQGIQQSITVKERGSPEQQNLHNFHVKNEKHFELKPLYRQVRIKEMVSQEEKQEIKEQLDEHFQEVVVDFKQQRHQESSMGLIEGTAVDYQMQSESEESFNQSQFSVMESTDFSFNQSDI